MASSPRKVTSGRDSCSPARASATLRCSSPMRTASCFSFSSLGTILSFSPRPMSWNCLACSSNFGKRATWSSISASFPRAPTKRFALSRSLARISFRRWSVASPLERKRRNSRVKPPSSCAISNISFWPKISNRGSRSAGLNVDVFPDSSHTIAASPQRREMVNLRPRMPKERMYSSKRPAPRFCFTISRCVRLARSLMGSCSSAYRIHSSRVVLPVPRPPITVSRCPDHWMSTPGR